MTQWLPVVVLVDVVSSSVLGVRDVPFAISLASRPVVLPDHHGSIPTVAGSHVLVHREMEKLPFRLSYS